MLIFVSVFSMKFIEVLSVTPSLDGEKRNFFKFIQLLNPPAKRAEQQRKQLDPCQVQ